MRLAALLLVALCAAGCGGTLVLESRTDGVPAPVPVPAPSVACPAHEVGKQEAVALVAEVAAQQNVRHTSVRKVERHKNFWKVSLRGVTPDGYEAEVRAKVDRWSGDIVSFKCEVDHDS